MTFTAVQRSTPESNPALDIPEDHARLSTLNYETADLTDVVLEGLKEDKVVLVQGVSPENADRVLASVAEALNLREQLEIQAGFASIQGHRDNIGTYFMSVNKRSGYQFIPPHSEGTQFTNMQLASFYCYENTTDGGENIMLNINSSSPVWQYMKQVGTKVDAGNYKLTPAQIASAKMMLQVNLPDDFLSDSDEVISQRKSPMPGIKLYNVLSPARKSYSTILDRDVYVYWDNMASTDFDSGKEFYRLLNDCKLLREPPAGLSSDKMDNANPRRVWSSGIGYRDLFCSRITRKLQPGELVIQNNLTWVHSTANWTPSTGTRKVAAAFA